MKIINGGVCAAKGFNANGIHCGIRKNKTKRDLSLIYSEVVANAAAVYTTNLVKGAPLQVTKSNISNGKAQAIICNSGNANTCNANGIEIATETCEILGEKLGIDATDVVVASTGVIGQPLDITPIANCIPALIEGLGKNSNFAAEGINANTPTVPIVIGTTKLGAPAWKLAAVIVTPATDKAPLTTVFTSATFLSLIKCTMLFNPDFACSCILDSILAKFSSSTSIFLNTLPSAKVTS